MRHLGVDYRISLLRAAAFYGASHQAAQVFQVVVPKQIRIISIGRQRIQFVYQTPHVFAKTNQAPWLRQLKTDAGFAKVAGIELLVLAKGRAWPISHAASPMASLRPGAPAPGLAPLSAFPTATRSTRAPVSVAR